MKTIKKSGRISGLLAGIIFLWAGSAWAATAQLPFYASVAAKPSVLILIDTSGSMLTCVNGSDASNCQAGSVRPAAEGGGTYHYPSTRIQIVERVLTGTGQTPLMFTYSGTPYPVYMGTAGTLLNSVHDDIYNNKALVPILLVGYTAGAYSLTTVDNYTQNLGTNGYSFYFVIKDPRDNPDQYLNDGWTASKTTNALNNKAAATYTLDRFLVDAGKSYVSVKATKYLTNAATLGGATITRTIYQASSTGTSFHDLFTQNYTVGNTWSPAAATSAANTVDDLWVYRVYGPGATFKCPLSTGKNCYKIVPFPATTESATTAALNTFVVMGGTDFMVQKKYPTSDLAKGATTLRHFISYYQSKNSGKTNYNSFNPTYYTAATNQYQVCGDGATWTNCTSTTNNADGNANARNIAQLVADTSPPTATSKRVRHPLTWSDADIATNITNAIPLVRQVDAWGPAKAPDGITGPEFIEQSTGTDRLDMVVRHGLDYYQTPANYLYTSWSRSFTFSSSTNPWFSDFFGYIDPSTYQHVWTGLPYTNIANPTEAQLGILDTYDVRYGLMIFDSSSADNDFNGSGANLIFGLAEGATNNLYLQEVISQSDQNFDGKIAGCPISWTSCKYNGSSPFISLLTTPNGGTPIAGSLRDIYTYLYGHYFTAADGGTEGTAPQAPNLNTGNTSSVWPQHDTIPSMYKVESGSTPGVYDQIWPTGKYNMTNYNGHVMLNDPYFYYNCRKSNVIFMTDGGQSIGVPQSKDGNVTADDNNNPGPTGIVEKIQATQARYLKLLVTPSIHVPNPSGLTWPSTKVYFIAINIPVGATGADTYAHQWLNAAALASKIGGYNGNSVDSTEATTPFYITSETTLVSSFNWIMTKIMEGTYTRSTPSVNANLTGGVAGYFNVTASDYLWHGHLLYANFAPINSTIQGNTTSASTTGTLDAAVVLNNRTATRQIFTSTYNSSTGVWSKLDFTTANQATLGPLMTTGAGTTATSNLITFIRTDSGAVYNDGTSRTWRLGAIYHSAPVSAAPPPTNVLMDDGTYQAYATAKANMPEIVYVGALDGMLHGFYYAAQPSNGTTLNEAFAYIPNSLLGDLHFLRAGNQEVMVDGDPNVGIERIAWNTSTMGPVPSTSYCNASSTWCWQTILYEGLRDGGQSYFSLNISRPGTTIADGETGIKPRWEYSDGDTLTQADDPILGNTWSMPYVTELVYKPASATTVDTRLALIFGGGTSPTATSYQGSWLYILDADQGQAIRRLLVPSISMHCNLANGSTAMLTPLNYATLCNTSTGADHNQVAGDALVLDVNSDQFPEWVFFGDVEGRVWKANISDPDPDKWGLCLFFDTGDKGYVNTSGTNPVLNTAPAVSCNGNLTQYSSTAQPSCVNTTIRRPVYYRPTATPTPSGSGWIIYVGTGHIEDSDTSLNNMRRNYVFALEDDNAVNQCTYAKFYTSTVQTGSSVGWPIMLDEGEKLISPPTIVVASQSTNKGEVQFSSFNPEVINNPCKPGVSYVYRMDYDTGKGALGAVGTSYGGRRMQKAGLIPPTLSVGGVEVSFDPTTGAFTEVKNPQNNFGGFFFWWIK